jgi:hypothetical protein
MPQALPGTLFKTAAITGFSYIPIFGGDEASPHTIIINIKLLQNSRKWYW